MIASWQDLRISLYVLSYVVQQHGGLTGAVSFSHRTVSSSPSLVPVHILDVEHSLLPDHVFGTVFLLMSVDLIRPWTPSATNWERIQLFEAPHFCFWVLYTNLLAYFKCFAILLRDDGFRSESGRLFYARGAATTKMWSPLHLLTSTLL